MADYSSAGTASPSERTIRSRRTKAAAAAAKAAASENTATQSEAGDQPTPSSSSEDEVSPKKKSRRTGKRRTAAAEADDRYTSYFVDALRVVAVLFLASCLVSYLVSDGETFFWGRMSNPPRWLRKEYWASKTVCRCV